MRSWVGSSARLLVDWPHGRARCGPRPHTPPTRRPRSADCVRYYRPRAERIGAMGRAEPTGFGELLKHYRTAARLTQEELAERAGLSARGVSDLERGIRRVPHPDTTRRLADALGLGYGAREELFGSVARAAPSPSVAPAPLSALPM